MASTKESIVAAAFEQAARDILMNTAARREAGADGVANARKILGDRKTLIRRDQRKRSERLAWRNAVEEAVADSRAAWHEQYANA